MVAKTNKNKKQAIRAKKANRVNKPRAMESEATAAAKRYAHLLLDPCRAELDYAPYSGSKLDYVLRKKSQTVVGADSYQVLFWHPTLGMFGYSSTVSTGAGALVSLSQGSPFLDSTFLATRPVAGCFGLEWIGAESGRQGWINAGIVTGSAVKNSLAYDATVTAFSIDSWARSATHTERMPIDKFEVNWVPGPKDATTPTPYIGGNLGATAANGAFWASELEGRNFIMIVLSNITITPSVLLTLTAVAEVSQSASVNVTSNAGTLVRPKFDYTAVIASLQSKDTGWYVNTFKKITQFAVGAVGAYTGGGLPGVLGYLTMGKDQTIRAGTRNYIA